MATAFSEPDEALARNFVDWADTVYTVTPYVKQSFNLRMGPPAPVRDIGSMLQLFVSDNSFASQGALQLRFGFLNRINRLFESKSETSRYLMSAQFEKCWVLV